ncbi:MAG: hypothetical protein R3B95_17865 [Nitrospirales bacterium]|nr:hypothetical protein [Nitrospirales bacterium]
MCVHPLANCISGLCSSHGLGLVELLLEAVQNFADIARLSSERWRLRMDKGDFLRYGNGKAQKLIGSHTLSSALISFPHFFCQAMKDLFQIYFI